MTTAILVVYIAVLLVGGWFGRVKAGSRVSLITAVAAAFLLGMSLALPAAAGLLMARILLVLLLAVFVVRLAKTRRFLPAGMLVAVTAVALVLHLAAGGAGS